MKTLLITGFDPFGGADINPSWEAVRLLPDVIGTYRLQKLQLPTVFGEAAERALEAAGELHPDAILSIGQAGGRRAVTPEVIAINLREAAIPDNRGNRIVNQPVCPDGPAAYFATAPVREMVEAMKAAGYPAALSYSAGAFVCNDVLYTLLHRAEDVPCVGFIHVPYLPEQTGDGVPSMPLSDIVSALTAAIAVLP